MVCCIDSLYRANFLWASRSNLVQATKNHLADEKGTSLQASMCLLQWTSLLQYRLVEVLYGKVWPLLPPTLCPEESPHTR